MKIISKIAIGGEDAHVVARYIRFQQISDFSLNKHISSIFPNYILHLDIQNKNTPTEFRIQTRNP